MIEPNAICPQAAACESPEDVHMYAGVSHYGVSPDPTSPWRGAEPARRRVGRPAPPCRRRRCIEANRDVILGVKLRLSGNLAADSRNEPQAQRLARIHTPQSSLSLPAIRAPAVGGHVGPVEEVGCWLKPGLRRQGGECDGAAGGRRSGRLPARELAVPLRGQEQPQLRAERSANLDKEARHAAAFTCQVLAKCTDLPQVFAVRPAAAILFKSIKATAGPATWLGWGGAYPSPFPDMIWASSSSA
jgi:hypothetical protein